MVASHTGQGPVNRFGDKSLLMTMLRLCAKALPGDYARTFVYRNLLYKPRSALRRALTAFYRMDHVYSVIEEFTRNHRGPFAILEFGVADGYSFSKKVFATRYLGADQDIVCHGFDSFEGLPALDDSRDWQGDVGGDWLEGGYRGRYEALSSHLASKYVNWRLHRGWFEDTLTPAFLEGLRLHKPILVWIDCDYYTSARLVMERLMPYLPNGCVVYFDEYEFNFGSRFTGEARLVHEINTGLLGPGVELVLDGELSWDLRRCYRFMSEHPTSRFERLRRITDPDHELRQRGNDSPLP
jgi:Macrocin-O-methyltransferase (TylF)